MNIDRVQKLEKFRDEDPHDPFVIYALATEWLKHDLDKSKVYFDELLNHHPDYLGTYYHAAALYILLNERNTANSLYQKGIELARKQNETRTLSELTNAYNEFLDDE